MYNKIFEDPAVLYGTNIEENIKCISKENFFGDIKEYLLNALPNFISTIGNIKDYLSNLVVFTPTEMKSCTKEQVVILKSLKDVTFTEASEILVPIPENFKGNYLNYLKELEPIIKGVMANCLSVVHDYKTYISLFLSTKDTKQRIADMTPKFKELAKYRESCISTVGKYFPKDTSSSRTMLKNVIERIADFNEIYTITNRIATYLKHETIDKLRNTVNDCYDLLKVIIKDINNSDSISKEAATNLSNGTYEVAKYVEMVSILYFDASVAIKAAVNMGDIIVETIKN